MEVVFESIQPNLIGDPVNKVNQEISVEQICSYIEQDARRYKKFLGDDGKMGYI